jgi:phosphatidylglycerol---prolipoprotein diacylglyceryl transferase
MESLDQHLRALYAAPVYALAYLGGALVFMGMARRRGLATSGIWQLMQAGLLGGLIGANLVQLLFSGAPGKAIEGAIAGGWLAVILMKRRLGIVRPTGDLFAPAIALGEGIGRIGCFIAGCCYGKAANVPWAVYDHGALRHPAQLYLSASAFLTFAVLMWLERRRILPENGLFYVQGMLFCTARFCADFFRDVAPNASGLTAAQLPCLAGFAVFAFLFARRVSAARMPAAAAG